MSSIYIQEPPTNGKVLLTTSVGELDIELWSKEAPKACRNFVQLCMEDYYDGTVFHRVVKDFIVQGGDPTGTGEGGESIYGGHFKDELHSRLRFVRRGLVAMANIGPHTNGSQFFFTMAPAPSLQGKHTIFGKVTGQTIYNMIRLQEIETDENERPEEPHKIIKSEILANPFEDITPRPNIKKQKPVKEEKKRKNQSKATKNFSLLSFGEEAEEDEEQTFKASKKFSGKSKSSHDLIDDPNLSSVPVTNKSDKRKLEDMEEISEIADSKDEAKIENRLDLAPPKDHGLDDEKTSPEDEKEMKREETRKEAKRLQRELKAAKLRDKTMAVVSSEKGDTEEKEERKEPISKSGEPDFLEKFKLERQKFKDLQKMQKKKGADREAQTMAMLSKFQSKLSSVQKLTTGYSDSEEEEDKQEDEENGESGDLSWMRHKLQFEDDNKRKVLDANITDSDRYEIHDPRNPMTQRRREASRKKPKTSSSDK